MFIPGKRYISSEAFYEPSELEYSVFSFEKPSKALEWYFVAFLQIIVYVSREPITHKLAQARRIEVLTQSVINAMNLQIICRIEYHIISVRSDAEGEAAMTNTESNINLYMYQTVPYD